MEKWLRRTTPVAPQRSLIGSTDLVLVARDGVERAHQAILARHSPMLRKLFWGLSRLTEVELINSKIPGIKPRLTELREPCELVTLLLPDYGTRTISALLDLLYIGQSEDCGLYTPGGELELVGLYEDLGLVKEYGGLPAIHNLEEVEVGDRTFPACKPVQAVREVVSSTTEPEERMPREDRGDYFILMDTETPGVSEEILLPNEPLDNEADEEDSAPIEVELNDVAVVMDEESDLPCGDSDGRAESRVQSPEPEIDELLGEGSDLSRPASQMSTNGEDAFLVENSTPAPESVEEDPEDTLASQGSLEILDKSRGKRICLRKRSTDSNPDHSQSSHGFSDTDVELARKRRRSILGEQYDKDMKSKQRRLSSAGEKEKRPLPSSEEGMICPLEDCGKELGGDVEKIAKHLIKHHLSKPPSCLYAEEKEPGFHKCNPCGFTTPSLSSFWAHEAVKHRNMHSRLGEALDDKSLSEDAARTFRVVDTFWKQVWRRGKDKEQSNQKSKIVTKVFASSDKQSPKKSSVATASGVMTCSTCGKESKTWRRLKEHVLVRHLPDKLADHYIFNAEDKSYSCEYGQECKTVRKNKCDIMMHLHCKHEVVTEDQILEIGLEKDTGDDRSMVNSPETVAAMNRQDCEVKMFNILEGVDLPSYVDDISNYGELRKPRHHRMPSSSDAGVGEKETLTVRCEDKSTLKRSKRRTKEKKDGKSAEQMPGLFTSPQILKSPPPSTSTSELASAEAASKRLSSTPKPKPISVREKSKSIERNEAEIDPSQDHSAGEVTGTKDDCESGGNSANDGVYTCRWCVYKYYEDKRLREHLLSKHKNEFKEVGLLEAGEKNYECTFQDCKKRSKSHAQFKNKSRVKYLRHLKEVHDVMVMELLLEETQLGDLFNFKEFCLKQKDAMLDGLLEKWEAPVVVKPHRRMEPEMVQLEDSVDEVGNEGEEEEIQSKRGDQADEAEASNCVEDGIQGYEAEAMEQEFSGEEESNVATDVKIVASKRRNTGEVKGEEESEFTCQICDQTFLQGLAVSLHMFQEHLKGLTSVWEPLVKPASPAAFPHSWTCVLCSNTFPTRMTAQLHIYTESQHKRMLKHSMEERKENWQHTLEFVRFKIPVDSILEEEEEEMVTSSTVEVREATAGFVAHSVRNSEAVEEAGEMLCNAENASAVPAGEMGAIPAKAFRLDSEPEHLELDYEPEDEDNNNGDANVNQSPMQSAVQSNENMSNSVEGGAGDQVKAGGRENRERNDKAAFEGEEEVMGQCISCSHARGGCAETFASMIELHDHARKCQFRPSNSFQCSTPGCGVKYYYEEDFKRHRQRCLDLEVFQCQDCDFFSSSMKEIVEHKMSMHL